MKHLRKCLSWLLMLTMLVGFLPQYSFIPASAAESKPQYKVEIVSFIRGLVDDLRCSELLEARIYKSTDGGATWEVATDVEGTPVSKLSYTWTNTSTNTSMVVFLTHDMTQVGLYGDTSEGTFQNGTSSTAVGGQWAAYKTPGVSTGTMGGGWPGMGNWWPGGGSGNNSSSTSKTFSGTATVQVKLPNGDVLSDSCSDFGQPDLAADLNNIALGLFIGESQSMLNLLGESALVHITCSTCSVSNIQLTDSLNCVTLKNSTVTGVDMGEATLSMTVSKKGCTVHNGQEADVETKIYVFRKPETSTTTTTLTLKADSLDSRCRYYINGVEGTKQTDNSILFTGLTPDTDYTVDVVASYTLQDGNKTVTRYAYAYVDDTTMPVYDATVNTYLDGNKVDIADIHGEDVVLYIKAENSAEYIYLPHVGTGTYSVGVDNGVYHVYHKEADSFHRINENSLVIANRDGSVNVHHYSVTYDPAGGAFTDGEAPATAIFASGKKVTAVNTVPTRSGYVFVGWSYGNNHIAPGATVTESITAPIRLIAQWEREANVSVNITIDHTYTNDKGNLITDNNNDSKDDVTISLVARDDANSPYLEVPNGNLVIGENSHNGHTLFVNGTQTDSYATAGTTDIIRTVFKDDGTPTFTGLAAGKEYFVTVSKSDYNATITATKQANGDWVIDVHLKFDPKSEDLSFEVKMDEDMPTELYPEAVIVKILFYNTNTGKWEIIEQHANGNPGVRVPIVGKTGNIGSYPVWVYESGETIPYYYRMMVSAFVYKDGSIVPTAEFEELLSYTDKNFTATMGNIPGGKTYGGLPSAYFEGDVQKGVLDATVTLEAYNVTFQAEGGLIGSSSSAIAQNQYYIPNFDQYVPTMTGHTFLGWWYKDANGNYTAKATAGDLLTSNITLYALWDQTLEGKVTISGIYEKDGQTMSVWPADRATQAMVILQEITSDTINNLKVVNLPITWKDDTGVSTSYQFEGLDPMKNYRIEVIVTNYKTAYQNSTTPENTYDADDYRAVYTTAQPWETFVNGALSFEPKVYTQSVEVDASQIGTSFRPNSVMTQIWYTERGSDTPYQVITQHNDGGLNVQIGADGKQNGTYDEEVWIEKWNGNLYDYQAYVSDTNVTVLPISIVYGHHSNFDTTNGQARNPLTVTLVPNRYDITFDLNTDAEEDRVTYYEAHAWSHDTSITYVPTRAGYVFKGWEADIAGYENGKVLASVCKNITLTAIWEKADIAYTVEYYYDNILGNIEEKEAKYLTVINDTYPLRADFNGKTYALDYVVGQPLEISIDESKNVVKVYYATDILSDEENSENTPDGIPDKYQAVVSFNIVNGSWKDAAKAATRVYTLYTKNSSGQWEKIPSVAFGEIPEGNPDENFDNVYTWTPSIPTTVERSATYTLSYNKVREYTITVVVENGTANVKDQAQTFTTQNIIVKHNDDLTVEFSPKAGYALDYIVVDGTVTYADGKAPLKDFSSYPFEDIVANHVIRVVYSEDNVGGHNGGDTIPDKYQKKITFKVVNGTWDGTNGADKVSYVTLKTDDKWDENGTADLPTVPTGMKPNANFKKGEWNVAEFPQTLSGTESVTYTHTFKPTAYLDFVYTVEHYKQQSNGIFVLGEREELTISEIELNADENGFQNAVDAVTAIAKNYGPHYSEDITHANRIAQGTPVFGQSLTLKLYYALDVHTVKYDLNGGNAEHIDYSDASYICGSAVNAKEAAHKHGYIFQGWKAEDGTIYQVNDVITVDQDIVLTAQWTRQTGLSYTVYFLEENTNKVLNQEKTVGNMAYGDVVNSLDHKLDIVDYIFVSASPETLTIDVDADKNIITLYYTLDTVGGGENGDESDDIPDKYQKKVTFKVVNGKWNDNSATDKVVYVTLMSGNAWDVNGSATITAPTVGEKPNDGFKEGCWDTTPPATVSGIENATYTYTYARSTTPLVPGENVLYIVEHYKAENGTYPATPTEVEHLSGKIGATVNAVAKNYDGYCVNLQAEGTVAVGVLKAVAADSDIVILKLFYDTDTIGGGNEGDESDDIPDKYQKKVTFKVVNGTWDDGTQADLVHILTLVTDGQWDINGTAVLDIETGMIADAGYGNGAWDITPPNSFSGTEDAVYTFTFVGIVTPPATGNNANLALWWMLLLISAFGMMVLLIPKLKKR